MESSDDADANEPTSNRFAFICVYRKETDND